MEIENAVNQAKKELASRFDFKDSKWEIVLEKTEIKLTAEDQFKVTTLNEIVIGRLAKRGISLKSVEQCEPDISPLGHARQSIKIKQGIESHRRQTDHRLHPRRQIQGHHADSGRRSAREQQEPGRIADRHRRRAREGTTRGRAVCEFPGVKMKRCSYCGKEFPDDLTRCPTDQQLLVVVGMENEDENNFKKVSDYSPDELKRFRETFASDLKQYRVTEQRYAHPLLVVLLVGLASVICSCLLSQPPLAWLFSAGIFVFALGMVEFLLLFYYFQN